MTAAPDVLVIGGGAAGLFCAYHLRNRGASVTVLERGEIGGPQSSSSGNTGFVGTHGVSVLAGPGMLGRGLRSRHGPVIVRPGSVIARPGSVIARPGLDRELLRWLRLFRQECRAGPAPGSFGVLVELKRRSLDLLRSSGLPFFTESGMVLAFRTRAAFERARDAWPAGVPLRVLGAEELHALEPSVATDLYGALYNEEGAFVEVPAFVTALGSLLADLGVSFLAGTTVTGFSANGTVVESVQTTAGMLRPGIVVVAAGAWSAACGAMLGVPLMVQPVRGYSVTVKAPPDAPGRPVLLAEGRAAVTPLGDRVRFAGLLEIGGSARAARSAVFERRIAALRRIVAAYLPRLAHAEATETWTGLRPCTPDSLPLIGYAGPYRNVFVTTGHGAMGMGLAPAIGELSAQVIAGEQPDLDLTPFRIDRFAR